MTGLFNTALHPHGAGGRFGATGGGGKVTVGEAYLKTANVSAADTIQVLSKRVKKYAGFKSVADFVEAHPKGRATALRVLAADHAAGRIAFKEAGKPPIVPPMAKAPKAKVSGPQTLEDATPGGALIALHDRGQTRITNGKIEASDRVEGRSKATAGKFANKTVGEFVDEHPRGKDAARMALAKAHVNGHVIFHRTVVPDQAMLGDVKTGITGTDYLVGDAAKYTPGGTIGDFVKEHPGGFSQAQAEIVADIKAGRVRVMRPKAEIPKEVAPETAAVVNFGANVSPQFKADVAEAWEKIPLAARVQLKTFGATMHAPSRLIDTAPEIADQQPRGWAPGRTWKNVDGCYQRGAAKRIICAETIQTPTGEWAIPSPTRTSERTKGVMLHETGHAIDAARGGTSEVGAFRMAYSADVGHFLEQGGKHDDAQYAYFLQPGHAGPSEMFAEMFADRMGHPSAVKHPPLRTLFPKCAAWMDRMIKDYHDA